MWLTILATYRHSRLKFVNLCYPEVGGGRMQCLCSRETLFQLRCVKSQKNVFLILIYKVTFQRSWIYTVALHTFWHHLMNTCSFTRESVPIYCKTLRQLTPHVRTVIKLPEMTLPQRETEIWNIFSCHRGGCACRCGKVVRSILIERTGVLSPEMEFG